MQNLLYIRLRAVNRDLKFDREYIIELGSDLFKHWYVVVTFGRYTAWGTSRTKTFDTREEACAFINSGLRRRLSSPKRIGCCYQIISFNAKDDILASINDTIMGRFSWFENEQNRSHCKKMLNY